MSYQNISSRAAGVVIYNNHLLVIYRKKNTSIYYTFPGGTVEIDESIQAAVAREVLEETSIQVQINNLLYQFDIISDASVKRECFYDCNYISGIPALKSDSIEFSRSNDNNMYQPMWIPIDKLSEIKLYPLEVRDRVINDLKNGFEQQTSYISVQKSQMRNT